MTLLLRWRRASEALRDALEDHDEDGYRRASEEVARCREEWMRQHFSEASE